MGKQRGQHLGIVGRDEGMEPLTPDVGIEPIPKGPAFLAQRVEPNPERAVDGVRCREALQG